MCKQNGLLARVLRYGIYVAFASDFVFFDINGCDDTILIVMLTHCLPESNFANPLSCFWQTFAMPMAKSCQ